MASANSTTQNTFRLTDFSKIENPVQAPYCAALADENERIVPNSRLSPDFNTLKEAFAALALLKSKHPDAAVFASSGLTADSPATPH